MPFAYITEYRRQAKDGLSLVIPSGLEPSLAVQKLAIGAGSVQSATFQPDTTFVCVNVDAACSIQFGVNPTATAAMTRMPLDGTQFFGVVPGHKIAVITNT